MPPQRPSNKLHHESVRTLKALRIKALLFQPELNVLFSKYAEHSLFVCI